MSLDELATCRYADFIPAMGVPVATSLGRPKFPLRYELTEEVRRLMPWGLFDKDLTDTEFTAHYRTRLDKVGAQKLRGQFYAISGRYGGARLVLLCFEPLDQFCHRHVWARWWEEQTGQFVPELSPMGSVSGEQLAIVYEVNGKGQP